MAANNTISKISPLITAEALKVLMGDKAAKLTILDCSHDLMDHGKGYKQFLEDGHIPTARFVSLEEDLAGKKTNTNGRHPIPDRSKLESVFRRLGVDNDTMVVAYDRQQGMYAGRLWWSFEWMGHDKVAVLDGGLQKWIAVTGGDVEKGAPAAAPAAGNFTDRGPLPCLGKLYTYEDIVENIASQQRVLVDARSADRYRGENETADPVGGHIPNAKNRFFRLNIDEANGGVFKQPAVLEAEFTAQLSSDIKTNPAQFVMQCGSGVTACHNLLALAACGIRGVGLYGGSWSEYCTRPNAAIGKGAEEK